MVDIPLRLRNKTARVRTGRHFGAPGYEAGILAAAFFLAVLCFGAGAFLAAYGSDLLGGILLGAALVIGLGAALYGGVLAPHQDRQLRRAWMDSFRHAVSAAPSAVVVTDAEGHILHANPVYREIAGDRLTRLTDIVDDLDLRERVLALATGAAQGHAASTEIAASTQSGETFHYRATVYPFPSDRHQAVWFLIDVTHLRRSLDNVGKQAASLAYFLDHIPLGFLSMDAAGRFVFVNRTFADWVGRFPEEMLGADVTLADFVPSEEATSDGLASLKNMEEVTEVPLSLVDGTGGTRPVTVTQSVYVDDDTGDKYTRTVVRDVGPERATQNELQAAKEHFVNFFEKAPLGIALVDDRGEMLEANPAALDLTGGDPANGPNGSFLEAIAAEDRGELARVLAEGENGRRRVTLECQLVGTPERFVQLYISRVENRPNASIIYIHETTEQKNLELQFAQSQKMQAVGQLAGGIAHDFNNLLTAILGFSDLLLTRHAAGDPSFTDIMQIKQNANRAASLVRQLLAFSRQQRLNPKVLVVTDVLAEVSHLIRRLIGENIELKISHDRNLGPVKVDQGQLEQVIINLAVNARDAMPDGGTVSIRTRNIDRDEAAALGHTLMPPDDYVMIEIADTGIGIPKETLGKIFEPFFTTKEVGQGTGLGLSTVYGIIKQTGGFIFPESEPGEGTAFRIYLPVHKESEEADIDADDHRQSVRDLTGKGTILLVEDEEAVRLFAARALENKGYQVLEAQTGEAALDIVKTHDGPIHLMVSDVVMPQMDGPTLLKHARETRQDMKIIFISGYAENALSDDLDEREFTFLPKPFSLKKLAETVKDVMNEEFAG